MARIMSSLSQELSLLETRGLVRVTLEREKPTVRFKHALTREATYNTILQARRAELHRAAAQTLFVLYPQPDLETVLTIAEHWQRGGEDGLALETILPHAQTLLYTGRGISLTHLLARLERENLNATQQRDLDIALADAHVVRGEYQPARALYERVVADIQTPALRARVLHSLGVTTYHLGDYAATIQLNQSSLRIAEELEDRSQQARATNGLGLAYWQLGDTRQAQYFLERSREISMGLGEGLELADTEYNMTGLLFDQGAYSQAIEIAQRVLALDEKLGNTTLATRTNQLLGACYFGAGDFKNARTYYEKALSLCRALGDDLGTGLGLGNLAELDAELGKDTEALSNFTQAITILRRLKYESLLPFNLLGVAQIYLKQWKPDTPLLLDRAQAHAQEALDIARAHTLPDREGVALRVLAQIYARRAEWARAADLAQQSIERLTQTKSVTELKRSHQILDEIMAAAPTKESAA